MTDKKEKKPLEIPESVKEEFEEIIKAGMEALKESFKTFAQESAEFEKRFAERRSKLKNGSRRRTSGRVI